MLNGKIVILGAGHVGSHVARALAAGGIGQEIVLVDLIREKAEAQAMDIADSLSFPAVPMVVRTGTAAECADAEVTVVAIGKAREPGQTRLDLLGDSTRMICGLAQDMKESGVGGPVVSITNPCDIILLRTLSEQTGCARDRIEACVLGEHGDSSMIPFSAVRIGGKKPGETAGFDAEHALRRTHEIGMDIINGKGSTEFGIGQAAAFLIRSILLDTKAVLPLSVHLEGEYGLTDVQCGVPCAVGENGIERIVELPMTAEEREALGRSAEIIRKHTRLADEIIAGLE